MSKVFIYELSKDKKLSLHLLDEIGILDKFDMRLSLLSQKFLSIVYLTDYIQDLESILQIRLGKHSIGYISLYHSKDYLQQMTSPPSTCYFDIFLKKRYRNKGYGTLALKLLLTHFHEIHSAKKILAYVDTQNLSSQKCLEKLGMTKEGNYYIKNMDTI